MSPCIFKNVKKLKKLFVKIYFGNFLNNSINFLAGQVGTYWILHIFCQCLFLVVATRYISMHLDRQKKADKKCNQVFYIFLQFNYVQFLINWLVNFLATLLTILRTLKVLLALVLLIFK